MFGSILGAIETGIGITTGNPALIAAGVSGVAAPSGISDKDKARVAAANSALQSALNGDASALQYMQGQANNSATQVGKNAFKQALQQYYAAQAQRTGGVVPVSTVPYQPPSTSQPSALQSAIGSTVQSVRNDLASGVQNIGAGSTTAASNFLSGNNSALTLPTNMKTIVLVGVAALGAFLIFSKHK